MDYSRDNGTTWNRLQYFRFVGLHIPGNQSHELLDEIRQQMQGGALKPVPETTLEQPLDASLQQLVLRLPQRAPIGAEPTVDKHLVQHVVDWPTMTTPVSLTSQLPVAADPASEPVDQFLRIAELPAKVTASMDHAYRAPRRRVQVTVSSYTPAVAWQPELGRPVQPADVPTLLAIRERN